MRENDDAMMGLYSGIGMGSAGRIRLFQKTSWTLNGVASGTQDLCIVKYVPSTQFVSGSLVVRVHAVTLTGTQVFRVAVQPASRCDEEPSTEFFTATGETVTTDIATGFVTPGLIVRLLTTPIADGMRVVLRAVQAATPSAMSITASADLIGRTA
jgi:hypothetical protein